MSGFFGVTTLGSDRPVYSHLRSSICATQYSDEEFKSVFDQLPTNPENKNEIESAHIITLLTMVYGTTPLPEELMMFYGELNLDEKKYFSWDELQTTLHKLRKNSIGLAKRATQYSSVQDLNDDKAKHVRCRHGPLELYKLPVTNNQMIGYFDHQKAIAEKEH